MRKSPDRITGSLNLVSEDYIALSGIRRYTLDLERKVPPMNYKTRILQ
jgi:hypothetical protein